MAGYLSVEFFRFAAMREAPVFRKHARDALGCQRVGKTLAFYGVKAGNRGIESETVILGVAGDDSGSAARNFDDIGVEHLSFLPLASVSTQSSGHTSRWLWPSVEHLRLTVFNVNSGLTRLAGANVSFKRNL
jgi:hypothetical protein